VDYVIDGFLLVYSRPSGAIRGKWRILDGEGECVMDCKFRALIMVTPSVSVKDTSIVPPIVSI
jgi:hypothetical protein